MSTCIETSKVTQEEHSVCNNIHTMHEFSYTKRQKLKGNLNNMKHTRERLARLELCLSIVNWKLVEIYENEEHFEMVECLQEGES